MNRSGLRPIWRAWSTAAREFLFPGRCLLCDTPSEAHSAGDRFCNTCLNGLKQHVEEPRCHRCGEPIGPYVDPLARCPLCRDESYAFSRVIRWGLYEDELRHGCVHGKSAAGEGILRGLGLLSVLSIQSQLVPDQVDCVIPVPQHWIQRWIRPHNSAEILAEIWARHLGLPLWNHALKKIRWTRKQVGLSRSQRRENLRDAFQVPHPKPMAGQRVLLVDDVLTTGSTVHHASRALIQAGATAVIVAVLARNRYSR